MDETKTITLPDREKLARLLDGALGIEPLQQHLYPLILDRLAGREITAEELVLGLVEAATEYCEQFGFDNSIRYDLHKQLGSAVFRIVEDPEVGVLATVKMFENRIPLAA